MPSFMSGFNSRKRVKVARRMKSARHVQRTNPGPLARAELRKRMDGPIFPGSQPFNPQG